MNSSNRKLDLLCDVLIKDHPIIIQAHDFPDHDAVAAGFALQHLLKRRGYKSEFCYSGNIQSASLESAIKQLSINLRDSQELVLTPESQIILVDGFIGNKNVTELSGTVVGVIDHHTPPEKPNCAFSDIRDDYGSCATILFEYYTESNEPIDRDIATALLMGLMMDTAFMTRGVTHHDMNAFSHLFFAGDWEMGSRTLRNSLSLIDLAVFREAINSCIVAEDFAFIPVEKECTPEVSALIADFFLGLREIHFVVVLVPDRDSYRISVRSEDPTKPSDVVIRKALRGIGYGGGHFHMGGGTIPRDLFPGEQSLRNRFVVAIGLPEKN
jgi:nanoRNase/pAp phosphatase (c-di-AMP/oligoRNAs hydrolase)